MTLPSSIKCPSGLDKQVKKRMYKLSKIDNESFWGIRRPDLDFFLSYKFGQVGIWSAGSPAYVHEIVLLLFEKQTRQPWPVLCADNVEYDNNGLPIKELKQLYNLADVFTSQNTIILDDNSNNFKLNKRNAIYIPEYYPSLFCDDVQVLVNLVYWFQRSKFFEASEKRGVYAHARQLWY